MVVRYITVLIVLLLVYSRADSISKIEDSPFPEFYKLNIDSARIFFNKLNTKQKFKVYMWDIDNWIPHNMYLGDILVGSGSEIIPFIDNELSQIKTFNAFKVWVLLDVLIKINEMEPIACNNMVIVRAPKIIGELSKSPYGVEIDVKVKRLVDECK